MIWSIVKRKGFLKETKLPSVACYVNWQPFKYDQNNKDFISNGQYVLPTFIVRK